MKYWVSKAALAAAILTAAAGHADDAGGKHPAWLADALVHDGHDPLTPGAPADIVRDREDARAEIPATTPNN